MNLLKVFTALAAVSVGATVMAGAPLAVSNASAAPVPLIKCQSMQSVPNMTRATHCFPGGWARLLPFGPSPPFQAEIGLAPWQVPYFANPGPKSENTKQPDAGARRATPSAPNPSRLAL